MDWFELTWLVEYQQLRIGMTLGEYWTHEAAGVRMYSLGFRFALLCALFYLNEPNNSIIPSISCAVLKN
jgi:hypothetical protein